MLLDLSPDGLPCYIYVFDARMTIHRRDFEITIQHSLPQSLDQEDMRFTMDESHSTYHIEYILFPKYHTCLFG